MKMEISSPEPCFTKDIKYCFKEYMYYLGCTNVSYLCLLQINSLYDAENMPQFNAPVSAVTNYLTWLNMLVLSKQCEVFSCIAQC